MSKLLYLLFFSPFLMLFTSSPAHQDQDPFGSSTAPAPTIRGQAQPARVISTLINQDLNLAGGFVRSKLSPMNEAMKNLQNAEDDDQKDDAVEEIRGLLEDQYAAFLESNEEQIEQLQNRLDQLKDQLKRRRQAKERLVDLEVERMINESEGLVWPSNKPQNGFFGAHWRNSTRPTPPAVFPNGNNGFSSQSSSYYQTNNATMEVPKKPARPSGSQSRPARLKRTDETR